VHVIQQSLTQLLPLSLLVSTIRLPWAHSTLHWWNSIAIVVPMRVFRYPFSCRVKWFIWLFITAALAPRPGAASACLRPFLFFDTSGFSPPSWFHGPWCERFSKSGFRAVLENASARFVQCYRSVQSSASCTLGWCAHCFCTRNCFLPMLIVKISESHCLHWDMISAGKFRWLEKDPSLFSKDMSMATWVLLHVAHPNWAPQGLVLDIKDGSPQFCVPSNPVLSVTSISLQLLSGSTLSTGEVWSDCEKIRPWRLKTGFFRPSYKSSLVARFHDGYKSFYCRAIGTFHDQHAVGIKVGS